VIAFAEELGQSNHVSLLNETLEEEKETDEKLTGLAGDINAQANLARKRAKKMPRRRKDPATQPSCPAPICCYKERRSRQLHHERRFTLFPASRRIQKTLLRRVQRVLPAMF
jgi:hypothetical protein